MKLRSAEINITTSFVCMPVIHGGISKKMSLGSYEKHSNCLLKKKHVHPKQYFQCISLMLHQIKTKAVTSSYVTCGPGRK